MQKITRSHTVWTILLLLVLWGSFAAGSKLAQRALDVHQLQFFIFFAAFLSYLFILIASGRMAALREISRGQWPLLLLCGGLGYGYFLFYNSALTRLPAPEASILNYTFPLIILVLDCLVERSRLTSGKCLAVGMGLVGVMVMASGGDLLHLRFSDPMGNLLALAGAICWATFSVLGRRVKVDILPANMVYMTMGLLLSVAEVQLCSQFVLPDAVTWLWVFWIGSCSFAFSNYLWLRLLRTVDVSLAAGVSFVTPFVTVLFIALLLGEPITRAQLLGLCFILVGMALERWFAARRGG